jgi:hypothetical protein
LSNVKATEFNTPPGQFVFGDLYEPQTEDFDGNPLVVKSGTDKGKPTQLYVCGLAIPKTQPHWGNEPGWGQAIWAAGHAAFPNHPAIMSAWDSGDFSWKIIDGDSPLIPKKAKARIPLNERPGHKGCWVLRIQSSFPPSIFDAVKDPANPTPLDVEGAVRPGYVIQVVGTVKGNTGASPGVYLNLHAVGLRAYLPEIVSRGIDVKGKFGGALPAGASTMPAASAPLPAAAPAQSAAPAPLPTPASPPAAAPAPAPAVPAAPAAPPSASALAAAPAMMGIPAPAVAPPPPGPPAAPVTPMHKGHTVASYLAAGWTMDQLKADGYAG